MVAQLTISQPLGFVTIFFFRNITLMKICKKINTGFFVIKNNSGDITINEFFFKVPQ